MEKDDLLEPEFWSFEKDGLYCGWFKKKPNKKYCIDLALRKLYGDDSHKPTGATRFDFKKK